MGWGVGARSGVGAWNGMEMGGGDGMGHGMVWGGWKCDMGTQYGDVGWGGDVIRDEDVGWGHGMGMEMGARGHSMGWGQRMGCRYGVGMGCAMGCGYGVGMGCGCDPAVTPRCPRPQLKQWLSEKLLAVQDVSYEEAHDLHSTWQKHEAFSAELACSRGWLDKMDQVGGEQPGEWGHSPQGGLPTHGMAPAP